MRQPVLELYNHQERQAVCLELWQELATQALPGVMSEARTSDAPLAGLDLVEVSLVSDEAIAQVHGEFMDDPTPTDVITFHHGEILISLDTARRQAEEIGEPYEREVLRYIVHGLLHLAGWDDRAEGERREMHAAQERILKTL